MSADRDHDSERLDRIERLLTVVCAQTDELHALAKRAEEAALEKAKAIHARARPKLGKKR
jgi:hypothetical protein